MVRRPAATLRPPAEPVAASSPRRMRTDPCRSDRTARASPAPDCRSRIPIEPGAAAARGPDGADLADGPARSDRPLARPRRRPRTPAAGTWPAQSADVGRTESVTRTIAGREVVLWRDADGGLVAGPGACPHLGALLDRCAVIDGTMYCRWHGLALTAEGDRTWSPYRAYDDGVLLWVGLPTTGRDRRPTRPPCPPRPPLGRLGGRGDRASPAVCEPQDVIANRLDPWHGSLVPPVRLQPPGRRRRRERRDPC